MPKYCCLSCPRKDYSDKQLDDKCPICGKEYQFPLMQYPEEIGGYKIIEPMAARGFYSVTYIAKQGRLSNKYVLKVSSKKIYEFFGKDFEKECLIHKEVAEDSEHVVNIIDFFEEDIVFGNEVIPCYISVLEYVNGNSLEYYLEGKENLSARTIAQIAIDLYRIIGDLESKRIYHNDLHGGNIIIQKLRVGSYRAEALDESVRAIMIDLGSVSDGSKSDEERLNDIHWISIHLSRLSQILLRNPEECEDLEYRLASLLNERSDLLAAPALGQRLPKIEDSIRDIKQTFELVRSPWQESPKFSRLDDAYNAQTLQPWFVPLLLVDPDKQWQAAVSGRGPQVIMGMRGCGKTMLLRSLQFHARATKENDTEDTIRKLREDRYVGLYVSCTKILETHKTTAINEPFARLLVAYALETLRAVRHLQEIKTPEVEIYPSYYRYIAEALSDSLAYQELNDIGSEYELERKLIRLQVLLSTGELTFSLKGHPADVFSRLSDSIKRCSSLWSNHYVIFLLDDVSTRFLNEERIKNLLSQLMFQSDECAFKFTTEAQTLELVLRSPGEIEKAREGRDYKVFDLGADVYEKVRGRGKQGTEFVESILQGRAKYYPNHPKATPAQVLGDTALNEIAEKIVRTSENSKQKKQIYWGISALRGVCVGDIGDVISIYELILRKSNGKTVPVEPSIQSECYQSFCSRRLYDVNRKGAKLKDFALSFAEAAHYLLIQSHATRKEGKLKRLRQYNRIYVRITTGDMEKQFNKLRELIDAGIFVLAGGSDTPRTKTRDSNPIQQFALTYRKLFGLSHFIGLAELDRFELSGDQLIEWLNKPEKGKDILLRNLSKDIEESDAEAEFADEFIREETQQNLFVPETISNVFQEKTQVITENKETLVSRIPTCDVLSSEEISNLNIDEVVVGLGFEGRTLESARRLLKLVNPVFAHLLYYPSVKGFSDEILALINQKVKNVLRTSYTNVGPEGIELKGENILVDITGLAKPFIFQSVRSALKLNKKVYICNTNAEIYYPKDEQIEEVLDAEKSADPFKLIEKLSQILVSGEEGRYDCEPQLEPDSDESRRRALCAFASAKHERLLTLLDERDYDHIEIVVPADDNPKSKIAKLVAEVAASNYPNAGISEVNSHNLPAILDFLINRYNELYISKGFNFETALSGSKLQTVACATLSIAFKISQCWYIRPQIYNLDKFTEGVGDSNFFVISVSEDK